ncbi:hypothetical protein [Propionivibrio limicola]|uniref:hypothetical protein n=1 Tax=Propionivibrio limicola TaxID=167645 RepID=UPI001290A7D0|nr:hypothetical protein [Propionivibrio limicola]
MKKIVLGVAMAAAVCGSAAFVVAATSTSTPAISKFFPVIREAAPGLDGYTVYRPTDLSAVDSGAKVPVLVWGNGACKLSNQQYWDVLGAVSARGFVVVAHGSPSQEATKDPVTTDPAKMTKAMDWLVKTAPSKSGYELVDTSKIGVFGTSCGGLEALLAAADSRVKSVGALNTGFPEATVVAGTTTAGASLVNVPAVTYSRNDLKNLHQPVLWLGGGERDVAYANRQANYDLTTVPTVLAENPRGGHSGLWTGFRYSATDSANVIPTVDYTITTESIEAVVRWFDYTLNGNTSQSTHFLGTDCGLCTTTGWTVKSKNFN